MALPELGDDGFTYQDYLSWPDQERWEIIHGEAFSMTPAPSTRHQTLVGNLFYETRKSFLATKSTCTVFTALTDVVLDDRTVIQPDLFIVCDKTRITPQSIQGPPDLIIEIVSKSSAFKDTAIKKQLYEDFGVSEYLLFFPDLDLAERYVLDKGRYQMPERFNWDDTLELRTFPITFNLWEIFERERLETQPQPVRE
ncbi:Uma2 family endonuclease [Desulfonatronum sp. SC1]|uniref:Uma2 family endonuclease n=1 Tax=Desulfonatronum sp. SC1 TaxID=2109626 RepID=UPI000D2FC4F7|nr:Uma2 family endonuclease [Desulfonatronum sp. SC1]PTN38444.1 Uma2 family endonuclease [Desulfonatronum sp. SC1]